MRVLVTGASGFVGRPLVEALTREGHLVRAAVRRLETAPPAAAEVAAMPDMTSPFDAAALVSGCDAVVHVAGLAHSSPDIPEATYLAVNYEASRRIALAARDAGCRRFIYISSVRAQTGPSADHELTEQHPPQPTDAYGRSKRAGELAVAEALRGSDTAFVILRPVLIYGPHPKGNMATLMKLARGRWPVPIGGLRARRSILGIGNFCSAVSHVLRTPACDGGTFLLADGPPVTAGDIVALCRKALGRPAGILTVPAPGAATLLERTGKRDLAGRLFKDLVVSTGAIAATGWQPPFTTSEGLGDAMRTL
jgi:UDP-glucose 4-epimerase